MFRKRSRRIVCLRPPWATLSESVIKQKLQHIYIYYIYYILWYIIKRLYSLVWDPGNTVLMSIGSYRILFVMKLAISGTCWSWGPHGIVTYSNLLSSHIFLYNMYIYVYVNDCRSIIQIEFIICREPGKEFNFWPENQQTAKRRGPKARTSSSPIFNSKM